MHFTRSLPFVAMIAVTLVNCGGGSSSSDSPSSDSSTSANPSSSSRSSVSSVVSSAASLSSSSVAAEGGIVKLEVPGDTAGDDMNPRVAAADDGSFVVAWEADENDDDPLGVFVQRFDAAGQKAGATLQMRANENALGQWEGEPVVTALRDGGFVIGWDNLDLDVDFDENYNIINDDSGAYVQKLGTGGVPVGTPVRLEDSDADPRPVATSDAGAFAVVYRADTGLNLESGLRLQRFDAQANASGASVIEADGDGGPYALSNPFAATVGTDYSFAACWLSGYRDTVGKIAMQKFDSAGNPMRAIAKEEVYGIAGSDGSTFQRIDWYPQIAPLGSDGGFVTAWFAYDADNATSIDDEDTLVGLQSFDGAGNPLVHVTLQTDGDDTIQNEDPHVATLPNGEIVVVWDSHDDESYESYVYVQRFDTDLNRVGTPVTLGSGMDLGSNVAAVGSDGSFVVTWVSTDIWKPSSSIKVQRFDANAQAVGETVTLNAQNEVGGSYSFGLPEIAALGTDGAFVVTWWGTDDDDDYSVYVRRFGADE